MTTLVSDIIRDAYRESNLISIGTEPSGAQRQEAIRFINRLVPSVLGYEGGENLSNSYLKDYDAGDDLTNLRIVVNTETPTSLTLPDLMVDGTRFAVIDPKGLLASKPLTIYGSYSTIENQSSVLLNTTKDQREYFYRADLGNWQKLLPLIETDPWPFPIEFDDMFIITLSFRLNPRYNISSQQESLMMLKRSMNQFRSRYKQNKEMPTDLSMLRLGGSWWNWYNYESFEKGVR